MKKESATVRPNWAVFERLRQKNAYQEYPKYLLILWANFKKSLFVLYLLCLLLGNFGKIWAIFEIAQQGEPQIFGNSLGYLLKCHSRENYLTL